MHRNRAHLFRLASVAVLAVLVVVGFAHVLRLSAPDTGEIDWQVAAEDQIGVVEAIIDAGPGDHVQIRYGDVAFGYRSVFGRYDFRLAATALSPAGAETVLFETKGNRLDFLELGFHEAQVPWDVRPGLQATWTLYYRFGMEPVPGPNPLAAAFGASDPNRYLEPYMWAALEDRNPFTSGHTIEVGHRADFETHGNFVAAEVVLAGVALALLGASWTPRTRRPAGGSERLMWLVERGQDHLRANLRLLVLAAPMLLLVGFFGIEYMDNGPFASGPGFDDARAWLSWLMGGLWVFAVLAWLALTTRILLALRHLRRTPAPDLFNEAGDARA